MRFKDFLDIDNLTHKKIDEKPINDEYKNLPIAKPTKNSSDKTVNELREMQEYFKSRTPEMEQSVKDHDSEVGFAIKKYLKENKLEFKESDIDKIADIGSGVVRHFKNKFERPRPYQLAEAMGMKFTFMPLKSDSMKSPAYPSGHAFQAYVLAKKLSRRYPLHYFQFFKIADRIASARVSVGLHYPSDNTKAYKLAMQL